MVKVNYSRNVVGCNVGGEIFVHPELHKYPELYAAIIAHEKKHTSGISGRDVAIDLFNKELKECKGGFYKFMLTHPRTMLGYLPLSKVGKHWCFDLELFFAWALLIIIGYFVGINL